MILRKAFLPGIPPLLSTILFLFLALTFGLTSQASAAEIGHYYTSHDDLIPKSCASSTWEEVTEYTIASDAAHANFVAGKKYLIVINFSILIGGPNSDQNAMARVLHGSQAFSDSTYRHENRINNAGNCGHGYHYWTVWEAGADEDIHIEVTQPTSTPTDVWTKEYEAFVINLDDLTENADWFYQTETHSGNLPTSWTPGASITFDGRSSDWLVLGLGRFVLDSATAAYGMRIRDVTDALPYSQIAYVAADANDYRPIMNMVGLTNVGADHTVRVEAISNAINTHDWSDSKIFALNLNKFVDHWTGYNTTAIYLYPGTGPPVYEVYGKPDYSATQTGDVLIWSLEVADVGENNKVIVGRIQVDGSTVPSGHQDARRELPHGNEDEDAHHHIYVGELSAGPHDIDIDMANMANNYQPAIDIHSLCIFSMEKGPCATPQPPYGASPSDSATGEPIDADLDWEDSSHTDSYDVYFGTSSADLQYQGNTTSSSYTLPVLEYATTYYWKIEAKNSCGGGVTTQGPIWSFTTLCLPLGTPDSPTPPDAATGISINDDLDWSDCSNATSYDVYFGTSSSPFPNQANTTISSYALPTLEYDTQYYWQVVAKNACDDIAEGPVWEFTTEPCPTPEEPGNPIPSNGGTPDIMSVTLDWDDSDDTTYYDVYFGTSSNPPHHGSTFGATSNYVPIGPLQYGTTYYWKIKANNNCPNSTEGPVWHFTPCQNPGMPSDPSPADDATMVSLGALVFGGLEWSDCYGATYYEVYFGTSSTDPQYQGTRTDNSYNVPDPQCGKHYYWQIIAKSGCGNSRPGPLWDFTTCPAPGTPVDPIPLDNAVDVPIDDETKELITGLDWSDCVNIDSYDVYFGTSSDPPLVTFGPHTSSSYNPGPLEYGKTYYWKIIAENDCWCTALGDVWQFKTACLTPETPINLSPENHAKPDSMTVDLDWSDCDYATSYDVYFGASSDPPLVTLFGGVTTSNYDPGIVQYGTTYYWKIKAKNTCANAEGPVWDFTPCRTPGTPASPTPANGTTNVDMWSGGYLAWSGCAYATAYDLYFGTSSNPPKIAEDITDNAFDVSASIQCGTTYYWKIVAKNKDQNGNDCGWTEGPVWSFTTCVCPGMPGNPSPSNYATGVSSLNCDDGTLELQWSACENTDEYYVEVCTDSTFPCAPYPGTCPVQKIYPTTNHCTVYLEYDTVYYWKVAAANDCYAFTQGPVWMFTTGPCPTPGVPSNPFPSDGATGLPVVGNVLEWSDASCAHSYDVYFGTSSDNPDYLGTTVIPFGGTNYDVPGWLEYDTTYYWKIVAINGWCGATTEGPVWSFTTAPTDPPYLRWTYDTGYTSDGVEPDTGDSGSPFEFRVEYTDPDNDPPATKEVWIDIDDSGSYEAGEKFDMSEVDPGDTVYTDGKDYTYSRNIDHPLIDDPFSGSDGNLEYRFYFRDWRDPAYGTPTRDHSFAVNTPPNDAPSLAWTGDGDTGYETDGVEPNSGGSGSTFEFRVKYTDQNGNPPAIKEVWIDLDDSGSYEGGEKFDMTSLGGTDYTTGVDYTFSRSIDHPLGASDGNLNYKFYFRDWGEVATGPPTTDNTFTVGCPTPSTPSTPYPPNNDTEVSVWDDIDWVGSDDAESYEVYFGTASDPPLVGSTTTSSYAVTLLPDTPYYWKIVAKNNCGGSSPASEWHFETGCATAQTPHGPNPGDTWGNVSIDIDLDWADSDYAESYEVYFGTSSSSPPSPPLVATLEGKTNSSYDPGPLEYHTDYYWKIVAKNTTCGNGEGQLWHFATEPGPGGTIHYVDSSNAGRAAYPFVTWRTAATTIEEAMDICTTGTIYVRKGGYAGTITMKSNVDVIGTNDMWEPPDEDAENFSFDDAPDIYGGGNIVVMFEGPLTNCKLQGFNISGGKPGRAQVEIDGSNGPVTDVTIDHCSLGGPIGAARIYMHGAVAPTISHCNIEDSAFPIITNKPAGNITYTGYPIIIKGNELHRGGEADLGAGIRLDGNDEVIFLTIGGPTINDRNFISGNIDAGISLRNMGSGSVVTVDNNSIYENELAGIDIRDVKGFTVKRNDIHGNPKAGIVISGTSGGTIGADLSPSGPADDIPANTIYTEYGNDIYGNHTGISFGIESGAPIDVYGTYVIRGNNIHDNQEGPGEQAKGAGIAIRARVLGGTIHIKQNDIYRNVRGGISIQETCTAQIIQNNIHHQIKRGGIHTDGPASVAPVLTIKQNKVHHNQNATRGGGIDVRHARGTISNNLVYRNARGGIRFCRIGVLASSDDEIKNNTVVHNGGWTVGRGGGIIYDDGQHGFNQPPSGAPPNPFPIKNNISAFNHRAGLRACFYETEDINGDKYRNYNLLHSNNQDFLSDWCGDCASPDCSTGDRRDKRKCRGAQLGAGCDGETSFCCSAIGATGALPGETLIFANPEFASTELDNEDYHLEAGSPAISAGEGGTDMGAYGGNEPLDDSLIPDFEGL